MTAETDCLSYCTDWPCPNSHALNSQPSQEETIAELIDHGSISFGRFAMESLAWEKWSVFTQNRCQEELEKFKAPGLVAQKKAYFEEYYKKLRAQKTLQAEQQETYQSDLCQGTPSITLSADDNIDVTNSKKGMTPEDVVDLTVIRQDSEGISENELIVSKQQHCRHGIDHLSRRNEACVSSITEPEHSVCNEEGTLTSSVKNCSTAFHQRTLVYRTVEHNANKVKDLAPPQRSKETVAQVTKNKVDLKNKEVSAKRSAKPIPSVYKDTSSSASRSGILIETATLKAEKIKRFDTLSSNRPHPEGRSSSSLFHALVNNGPSSSSSIRSDLEKATSNLRGSINKSTAKQISITGVTKKAVANKRISTGVAGKSLEPNRCLLISRREQPENQRPLIMSPNLPALRKSNQNLRHSNDVRGVRSKKEITAVAKGLPCTTSSAPSGIHKDLNSKLEHKKVVSCKSANCAQARKETRQKIPRWR